MAWRLKNITSFACFAIALAGQDTEMHAQRDDLALQHVDLAVAPVYLHLHDILLPLLSGYHFRLTGNHQDLKTCPATPCLTKRQPMIIFWCQNGLPMAPPPGRTSERLCDAFG